MWERRERRRRTAGGAEDGDRLPLGVAVVLGVFGGGLVVTIAIGVSAMMGGLFGGADSDDSFDGFPSAHEFQDPDRAHRQEMYNRRMNFLHGTNYGETSYR